MKLLPTLLLSLLACAAGAQTNQESFEAWKLRTDDAFLKTSNAIMQVVIERNGAVLLNEHYSNYIIALDHAVKTLKETVHDLDDEHGPAAWLRDGIQFSKSFKSIYFPNVTGGYKASNYFIGEALGTITITNDEQWVNGEPQGRMLTIHPVSTVLLTNVVETDNHTNAWDEIPTAIPAVFYGHRDEHGQTVPDFHDWTIHHPAQPATERYVETRIVRRSTLRFNWHGAREITHDEQVSYRKETFAVEQPKWSLKSVETNEPPASNPMLFPNFTPSMWPTGYFHSTMPLINGNELTIPQQP